MSTSSTNDRLTLTLTDCAKIAGLIFLSGMHGAAFFFCLGAGRGGAEEKIFGAGQGENARGGAG